MAISVFGPLFSLDSGAQTVYEQGHMHGRIQIVIPAYNEEQTIVQAIRDLKAHGFDEIVVVDDGSRDRTAERTEGEGIVLYRHVVNRGLGVALGTGIEAALRRGAEVIVTRSEEHT